jgi:hypothetical protein
MPVQPLGALVLVEELEHASASLSVERDGRRRRHAQAHDAHRPRRRVVDAAHADVAARAADEEDVQPLLGLRVVERDAAFFSAFLQVRRRAA